MSYTLQKPYTDTERADFIVLHNHNNGRKIEETSAALYALEADEIMQDGQPVKNPDYESEQLEKAKVAKLAENKSAYESALKSGITYKGELFDCDTLAAVRIMGQMIATQSQAIAEESTIEWFDYNYKPVTLSISEFIEFAGLVTLNTRRIETLNCSFNTAIEAAQTMEELESIEIDYTSQTAADEGSAGAADAEINSSTVETESEDIDE